MATVKQNGETIKTVEDAEGNEYDVDGLQKLGQRLSKTFSQYRKDRKDQENKWLQDLYQFMGKYDPEIANSLSKERSRAYPKLTRTKIMVIVARLMNLLFPQSDKSWSIVASKVPYLSQDELQQAYDQWRDANPEAEVTQGELDRLVKDFADEAAERLERYLEDQLTDAMGADTESDNSDFVYLCRKVILSSAIYGVGIIKGPLTISYRKNVFDLVPGSEPTVREVDSYRPYFDLVTVWDYYPDMHARTFEQMDGQFEDHIFAKHQLQSLGRRPDFFGELVDAHIYQNPNGNYEKRSHENQLESLNRSDQGAAKKGNNKYRLQEYWGVIEKALLEGTGIEIPDEYEDSVVVPITAWIAGEEVIKLAINPLPQSVKIYHQFVFDDSVPNLCGGSMCEIVRDSQMAVSSAARMMIDNASVTCGPNVEIDISKMRPGQDVTTIGPFRAYYTDGRRNQSGHRAVNSISFDSHLNELLQVMNQFLTFADMETFVGGYGDESSNTPGEALRTSAGASMVLGNAALPFRDIVRSFDQFTVSVLNSLIAWNDIFNEELDVLGDLRPVARGSTSLIAKEVQAFTLDNLSQTLSEEESDFIDHQKLVKQRLISRDIPELDVMVTDEEAQRRRQRREQQQDAQFQQQQELMEAQTKEVQSDALKNTSQAKKNLDGADADSVRTLIKLLETVQENVNKGQEGQQRVAEEVQQVMAERQQATQQDQGQPGGLNQQQRGQQNGQ